MGGNCAEEWRRWCILYSVSGQSLKNAVGILQESMKNFVEHLGNVTKGGTVNHVASSFGCCCID